MLKATLADALSKKVNVLLFIFLIDIFICFLLFDNLLLGSSEYNLLFCSFLFFTVLLLLFTVKISTVSIIRLISEFGLSDRCSVVITALFQEEFWRLMSEPIRL